ncbi:ATP-binding cassette domain-containing protein [Azospirillum brasilense]|uniref:ATP-binding cassette domain-containing protein n=1 Tax=Azospirillum brasilense TaxID=192 RepID=A0A4D8R0N1_AZOBR|nr:ATP-binding cassette domain-containing protein [Azospirillum brasilense]QCO14974.1 ATP-binding cassette domain-containing protein [Azospirillum brasilense]
MHRHPPTNPHAPEAVLVENVHKRFGPLEVLKGVSLTAREGDVITLIGSSGSGKSTLLRCINMLEVPDEGRIVIGGEAIGLKKGRGGQTVPADSRQVDRIRTRLGMVFQSFNLWTHMTILENVIEAPVHVLGVPKAEAVDRARKLLDKVGILAKAESYPVQLSGGQQQRAAIARALAMQPKVMLFDEPTSALDPELVGEVLLVIRQLAEEGNTMILVTHEMGFAREVASEVVFLHQGRIEERGPPDRVLVNPESDRVRQFLSRHLSGNG